MLKQSKNRKYRITPINPAVHRALEFWLVIYGGELPDAAPLFPSYRYKGEALRVPSLCNLVKRWCACAGVQGNYGSHTLRKTWGYQQRLRYEAPLSLLVKAYGHSSERITLDYLGIQPKEITDLYRNEI